MNNNAETPQNKVAILPHQLLLDIIEQLCETREEIWCFAGQEPDEDATRVLANIETKLTQIKTSAIITPDPWEALAAAEMALSDLEVAKQKSYICRAKKLVYAVLDAKRQLNDSSQLEGQYSSKPMDRIVSI